MAVQNDIAQAKSVVSSAEASRGIRFKIGEPDYVGLSDVNRNTGVGKLNVRFGSDIPEKPLATIKFGDPDYVALSELKRNTPLGKLSIKFQADAPEKSLFKIKIMPDAPEKPLATIKILPDTPQKPLATIRFGSDIPEKPLATVKFGNPDYVSMSELNRNSPIGKISLRFQSSIQQQPLGRLNIRFGNPDYVSLSELRRNTPITTLKFNNPLSFSIREKSYLSIEEARSKNFYENYPLFKLGFKNRGLSSKPLGRLNIRFGNPDYVSLSDMKRNTPIYRLGVRNDLPFEPYLKDYKTYNLFNKGMFPGTINTFYSQSKYVDNFYDEPLRIKFVESYTEPTSLGALKSLQGKSATSVHVTVGDPFAGGQSFITKAIPGEAGGFRQNNLLLNFYKSSPEVQNAANSRAYLGYAGVLKSGVDAPISSERVIFGKPDIKFLVFKDDAVSYTPKSVVNKGLLSINQFQAGTTGKTFVPAENFYGSPEGQLITPSNYADIPTAKRFGLQNSPGSLVMREGESKYGYYRRIDSSLFGEVTGSNYFKVELIRSKTLPVADLRIGRANVLDLADYNAKYTNIRYSESPSVLSRGSAVSSSFSRSSLSRSISRSMSSKASSSSPSYSLDYSSVSSSLSKSSLSSNSRSRSPSRSKSSSRSSSSSAYSSSYSYSRSPSYSSSYSYTSSPPPPTTITPPLSFRLNLGGGGLKNRSFKARKVTSYSPSYSALFFKIGGNYQGGNLSKSGLDFRPITKGFNLMKLGAKKVYSRVVSI
jgi:hypothetical protein